MQFAGNQYRIHRTADSYALEGGFPTLSRVTLDRIEVSTYTVPTDSLESDGTSAWNSTTLVAVRSYAGNTHRFGYTYGDTATATLVP